MVFTSMRQELRTLASSEDTRLQVNLACFTLEDLQALGTLLTRHAVPAEVLRLECVSR